MHGVVRIGARAVACASTGNLANAVAAHAAAAGLESYVFIPADLEEQKILATGVYGTRLVAVRGNYDDVNRLCTELSAEHPWAFVNVNLRPYYSEGSKTVGFEVAEQLGLDCAAVPPPGAHDEAVHHLRSATFVVGLCTPFDECSTRGIIAIRSMTSLVSGTSSSSFPSRRYRLSQPKVRSTSQRFGCTSNVVCILWMKLAICALISVAVALPPSCCAPLTISLAALVSRISFLMFWRSMKASGGTVPRVIGTMASRSPG